MLATVTLFFGFLLIAVLLTVSVNQRLGGDCRAAGARAVAVAGDGRRALRVGACSSAPAACWRVPLGGALVAVARRDPAQRCPASRRDLHFFVFEPRALVLHVALLAVAALAAAVYPMRIVAALPIAATLRREVVS